MDTCPPEILRDICFLACTDDGKTGRSLALTSTRIHDISTPFRYQSISIVGIAQLRQFVKLVLDIVPPSRLHVKYLFLETNSPFRDAEFYGKTPYKSSIENKDDTLHSRELMTFLSLWRTEITPLFERLMSAVDKTLTHLHLNIHSATVSLDRYCFPMLEELHMMSPIRCGWEATQFPQLKRLRIYTFAHDFFENSDITGLDVVRLWARSPDLYSALDTAGEMKSTKHLYLEWDGRDSAGRKEELGAKFPSIVVVRPRTDMIVEDWWDSVSGGPGCFVAQ